MKKYICIKEFCNVKVGEIFIESDEIHKKWKQKMYFFKKGGKDNWVLESHIKNKKHFELIN